MLSKISDFLKKNVGPGKMLMWNWLVIVVVIIIIIIIVIVIVTLSSSDTTTTTAPVMTDLDVRIYMYDKANPNTKWYLSADSALKLVSKSSNATKFQIITTNAVPVAQITGSWGSHFYIQSGTSKLTFAAGDGTCNVSMSTATSDGNVIFFRTIDMIDPVPDGTILNFNSPIGISPALSTVACYGQALAVNVTSGVFYSVNSAAAPSANMTWYFEPA
jgi:hypothetical protein